jgi:hypothetical protein
MKGFRWITILTVCSSLFVAGCGKKASETTEHAEEGDEGGGGVAFKEGSGLALNPDVARALGLIAVEVDERPLSAEMKLLAQVFATTPQILASASMTEAEAERLEKQSFTGAKLVRVDRAAFTATQRVDAIFTIQQQPAPKIGEFVELALTGESHSALVVPRSAVLDTATGTFAYVVNGENYLRTSVKTGGHSGDFVEITDGLYSGDVVVTTPVSQLWLAELRLTKGGGHSH